MAFLILKDGRKVTLKASAAARMWQVSTGEVAGSPEEQEKASQVAKFYLNPDNAPASWKARQAKNSGLAG